MHRATFSIPCEDPGEAQVIQAAVGVDAADGPEGTTATLSTQGTSVTVDIEARDLSGLRAAVHSVLRLMDAARRSAR